MSLLRPFLVSRLVSLAPRLNVASVRAMSEGGDSMHGTPGAIRDAGGAFGKKEKAIEDQYFRREEARQLADLREHLDEEIAHHEHEIKRHQEAIDRHMKKKETFKKAKEQHK